MRQEVTFVVFISLCDHSFLTYIIYYQLDTIFQFNLEENSF